MKKILTILTLFLFGTVSVFAQTEVKLEIDSETRSDVSSRENSTSASSEQRAQFELQKTQEDSDEENEKGNVEYGWKVEEGEKNTEDSEFKGGIRVSTGDVNGLTEEEKRDFLLSVKAYAEVKSGQDLENFARGILLSDSNFEDVEVEEDKVKISYRMPAKLFGIFNSKIGVETEIDSQSRVKVKYPWFGFIYKKLVSSSDIESDVSQELSGVSIESSMSVEARAQILEKLSLTLKTRHDIAKNSVSNIR